MFGARAYLALAVIAAIGFAGWRGWAMGRAYERGQHAIAVSDRQAEIIGDDNAAKAAEAERLRAESVAAQLALQLEDAAHAQPVDDTCGLGVERVRRLNLR